MVTVDTACFCGVLTGLPFHYCRTIDFCFCSGCGKMVNCILESRMWDFHIKLFHKRVFKKIMDWDGG
jgi:hypothetical protein